MEYCEVNGFKMTSKHLQNHMTTRFLLCGILVRNLHGDKYCQITNINSGIEEIKKRTRIKTSAQ